MKLPAAAANNKSDLVHPLTSSRSSGSSTSEEPTSTLGLEHDTSYLAAEKLYVDVRRKPDEDCLGFGLKADVGFFSALGDGEGGDVERAQREVEALAQELAREVQRICEDL
jgi:hypothetical protein